MANKHLRLTLIRSLNKRKPNHIANAKGLGLKHLYQTVELQDTPSIRGMINQIYYLVKIEEAI